MGKGFRASNGLVGQDLGDLITSACATKGLHVELAAIVNDSTAALLSQAYLSASTRFGLILGTGVNIAVHLPVAAVGRDKYGDRPDSWFEKASHVVVNTELGMFGKGVLPLTRWDHHLNAMHPKPDFQPLEHLVSGFYLGELCRLALVEAIDTAGVLGGVVPPSLLLPYSLDTETISFVEAYVSSPLISRQPSHSYHVHLLFNPKLTIAHPHSDTSSTLESSRSLFISRHPSSTEPTTADIIFLRRLASLISRRSSAIVAASLFALWDLKREAEVDGSERALDHHVVAFNGSVIEQYPGYLQNCQTYIDELISSSTSGSDAKARGSMKLVGAKESSLLGAAVALACLDQDKLH